MGCCNSKPKEKAPPPEKPAPPAPKLVKKEVRPPTPVQEEVIERAATPEADPAQAAEEARDLRIAAIMESRQAQYRYNRCTVAGGESRALFQEGIVYRVIKDGVWYIYNDSLEYEAHVEYSFAPGSQIEGRERTELETSSDGWIIARVVVYPLETVEFIAGSYSAYRSNVTVKPVNPEYLGEAAHESMAVARGELAACECIANGSTDEEVILTRCVASDTPYVDVNFPPSAVMLARPGEDAREMSETAMTRPTQYLPADQRVASNAVIGAIVPHSIDPGCLGDSWVTCAAAVMAENEDAVKSVFASTRPEERGVGAYRVALSKHGWWRSVIVDNYLPTIHGVPVFSRIQDDPRELWVSLMEKAYAKVHGSYATITGGDALHMIQDFTGAPTYRFDKEWEAATMNAAKVPSFAAKLVAACDAGYGVVLSTPAHTSTSYLGCKRDSDPDAFKLKYTSVGLRCGYTYAVEKVASIDGTVLLKVRNPWDSKATWTGAWSAGSAEWNRHSNARHACHPEDCTGGSFWICWNDAINYFDGGGIIYCAPNVVDYRVKGNFEDVVPSVVLEITATEPVEVMLVLSQQDKRGGSDNDAGLRFAPCMLSIAKHNGNSHVVEANTSWDSAAPSSEYNFMVSRDMAAAYTFEPSEKPYLVVPRIHRKGVSDGYDRPYVIGIIGKEPLDGKLSVRCTHIDGESRAFKNIITFHADHLPGVDAEHQKHQAGEMPVNGCGEMVLGSAPAAKAHSPSASSADLSAEESDHAERDVEPAQEPEEVTVTDAADTPVSVEDYQDEL